MQGPKRLSLRHIMPKPQPHGGSGCRGKPALRQISNTTKWLGKQVTLLHNLKETNEQANRHPGSVAYPKVP